MGKSPLGFAALNTLSPLATNLRRKPGPADSIAFDEQCVPMNTPQYIDHSQGDSGPAGRTRSFEAKPVARLESLAAASLGSFRGGERCHPATGPEDL
jgi:hypothetical protein